MIKGIFYHSSVSIKVLFSLFLIFFSFFLMYVIGIVFVQVVYGIDIIHHPEILQEYTSADAIKVLKFFQLVQSIGIFVLPPFLIAYFFYHSVSEFLKFRSLRSTYVVILSIIGTLSFIPFSNLLSYINSFLTLPSWMSGLESWMKLSEHNANALTVYFLKADSIPVLLYNILLIAIIPAIGEELLFRGVVQRLFTEWTKKVHLSIWLAAILFSAIHFQFYGFLPRLFLGITFGYLLEITGTIWIPIIGHFVNNLTGVLLGYFEPNENIVNNVDSTFSISSVIYGFIGLTIGVLCIWLIARKTNRIL
jgi:hypothetical protein